MKKKLLYALAALIATPVFWSCDDAQNNVLENSIYLTEAQNRDDYDCLIKPLRDNTYNVTVKMTHKLDHDVKLNLVIDRGLLTRHFEQFGEDIKLLPEDYWILYDNHGKPMAGESMMLTIPAGQTTAILPIKVKAMANPEESQYALPISIKSLSEDIHVLEKLSSQLFVFQAPFETDAIFYTAKNQQITGYLNGLNPVHNWTIEFHFHIQRGQSQPLYGCPLAFMGPNEIYIRQYHQGGGMDIHILGTFGPGSYNVSKRGYPSNYYYDTAYQGQWNHFALVCENGNVTSYLDGQEMGKTSSPQFNVDFLETALNIGAETAEARLAFAEMRFWSVARTDKQLNRFKYDVDPNTPGLEVYYKLNDCSDTVIKDYSHNGFDIDLTELTRKNFSWGRIKTNDDYTSFVTVSEP